MKPRSYTYFIGKYKYIFKRYNQFCDRLCYLKNNRIKSAEEYYKLKSKLKISKDFKSWFAGFIDGEGTFAFKKDANNPKGFVSFIISQKEKQVIDYIYKTLKFGILGKQLCIHSHGRTIMYVYRCNGYAKCKIIYNLVKKYIKTINKLRQLNKWAKYFESL